MKQNAKGLTLIACAGALAALPALAGETPTAIGSAAVKGGIDKETGQLRRLNADEERELSLSKKPEVAAELNKRLGIPTVTVVHAPRADGTQMIEIGLDQLDFLVVQTDADGKPVVQHRSNASATQLPEEK